MPHVLLTDRWTEMREHAEQQRLWLSKARFKTVPAGRRSGKTELAKRKLIIEALRAQGPDPNFFAAAPTRDQAKTIYWKDLKNMVPTSMMQSEPKETELSIHLINGAMIRVVGMDKPQRIEGTPWNGGVLDEYANMKEVALEENVLPALADRMGWLWCIGVPEGRNHYYDLCKDAKTDPDWDFFTWKSIDILPPAEVEMFRRKMDPLTFRQEFEASFEDFKGRAYYQFTEQMNCANLSDRYNPKQSLIFTFDFNVDPGVAVIAQEMDFPTRRSNLAPVILDGQELFKNVQLPPEHGTGVIGEVHIPNNSNTPAVCRKLVQDWGQHEGHIYVYGDATGGSRKTSATEGNDWDLVKRELYGHFGQERVHLRVPRANPSERSRLNSMNSRLLTADGTVHMMVDSVKCPHVVRDMEGVRLLEGGSGEIDKKHDPKLTHLTDALGYYIVKEFPVRKIQTVAEVLYL